MTVESSPGSDEFLLERAATEHDVAERKRDATLSKASAVATLAAALVAVLAAPAFDASGLAGGVSKVFLLVAILAFAASIVFSAVALWSPVDPGDRPSRDELDNWVTNSFREAEVHLHVRDFTEMYVLAAQSLRKSNERAQAWLGLAVAAIGFGLLMLLATLIGDVA